MHLHNPKKQKADLAQTNLNFSLLINNKTQSNFLSLNQKQLMMSKGANRFASQSMMNFPMSKQLTNLERIQERRGEAGENDSQNNENENSMNTGNTGGERSSQRKSIKSDYIK